MGYIQGATKLLLCQVLPGKVGLSFDWLDLFTGPDNRPDIGYYGRGVYFQKICWVSWELYQGIHKVVDESYTTGEGIVIEPWHDKTCLREFPTMPDTNTPVQPQTLARVLKFQLQNLEILYYLSSKQQRHWSDRTDAQADLRLCCSHMT